MESDDNRQLAIDFLRLASSGQSREAFNKFVAAGFKHHNAFFKGDAESLILGMEENAKRSPAKIFEVKKTLLEGNLVMTYSCVKQDPNDTGALVVHIFRFDAGKIVELWDIGQAIPTEIINENGMF